MTMNRFLLAAGAVTLLSALARPATAQQDEAIATPTIAIPASPRQAPAPAAKPAPAAAAPGSASAPIPADATSGTTIVGDQESPIGLYITPWKDDYAERGLDRPARLVDEAMEPIDPATFRRQIEYYETITAFRKRQQGAAK